MKKALNPLVCVIMMVSSSLAMAEGLAEAVTQGDVLADLRLRYETNDTDGGTDAATALTLRTRIGYETAAVSGVKALAEIEDVRAVIDEYSPQDAQYDKVADPENTEFNRAQISYANDYLNVVAGRQRIILDNARFVGNVGWRQNEQTYDAVLLAYHKDQLSITYAFIDQINGTGFTSTDVSGHALNLSVADTPVGKAVAYAYLVSLDDSDVYFDTYGASLSGKQTLNNIAVNYRVELATQSARFAAEQDASYYNIEAGATWSGVNLTLGNETLGSDDGAYGFQTLLATKHAFNGWADKFLSTPAAGLSDSYVKISGSLSGVKLLAVYHTFETDKGSSDLGSEMDAQLTYAIDKHFSTGLKYAAYSAGDVAGFTDTDKLWLWLGAAF